MAFQANNGPAPDSYNRQAEENPMTPRPSTAPTMPPQHINRFDDSTTPTRATFGAMATQRPLPAEPFPPAVGMSEAADSPKRSLDRVSSTRSSKSRESEDVDMDDGSDDDDGSGSDEETINPDGTRTTKKKKSQKFYCTDFPPCTLSFTRSEHLARHIRKHTGERPFQCHCSRRFSRLDNLRQHAQTVHVNEEIPGDSLAATGTRFQRQVRTDRVRPPGNRSRANTAGSQTSTGRGHHRNSLSASSISSVGSSYSARDDVRRRPPPLVMAADPRNRMSMDSYVADRVYRPESPGGFSTPTSATFSTGHNSPRWSNVASPISHSRTASLYNDHRTPGRRLSVPSGANPFQNPQGYGQPPMTPMNASNQGSFMSPTGSIVGSPTSSTGGPMWGRRDSVSSNGGDEAWRRRTWHPETYSTFTSRLMNVTTPNHYQSQAAPPPQDSVRLPGISSFDPLQRPATPTRRQPSPMLVDTPSRVPFPQSARPPQYAQRPEPPPQYNVHLHRDMNRLEINQRTPPRDAAGAWAREADLAVQAQAEQSRAAPTVRFEQQYHPREQSVAYTGHPAHASAPPVTPREAKRRGWYQGPLPTVAHNDTRVQRTSPEGSSSSEGVPGTPGSTYVADPHPSIVHSSGWVEPSQRPPPQQTFQSYGSRGSNDSYTYASGTRNDIGSHGHGREETKQEGMMRLEALVAVATSEGDAAAY